MSKFIEGSESVNIIKVTVQFELKHILIELFLLLSVSISLQFESAWLYRHTFVYGFDGYTDQRSVDAELALLSFVLIFEVSEGPRSELDPSWDEILLYTRVKPQYFSLVDEVLFP